MPAQMGEPHDEEALAARLREAVGEVVKRQADLGIDIVDDGEYSKNNWANYVIERLSGVEPRPNQTFGATTSRDRTEFAEFYADCGDRTLFFEKAELRSLIGVSQSVACVEPLKYSDEGRQRLGTDISNLRAAVDAAGVEEAFMPVVAPSSVRPYIANEYYKNDDELFEALADVMRSEYSAIVEAGFICQIDDAFLPYEWDRRQMEEGWTLESYRNWASLAVDALNAAIEGLPEDRLRYHICWGSWNGPHGFDIPLSEIVDLVLKINVQAYLIEAANARHEYEYTVWEEVKLPDGKILVPGVIEHMTHVVEHPKTVAERIIRFANVVGRENVIGGTDCGLRGRAHPQIAWAKLKALSDGAAIASERLWR